MARDAENFVDEFGRYRVRCDRANCCGRVARLLAIDCGAQTWRRKKLAEIARQLGRNRLKHFAGDMRRAQQAALNLI